MTEVFATLFLLMAAGAAFRFIPGTPSPESTRHAIGMMVLNVFLPALTFNALATAPLTFDLFAVPLVAIVVGLASLVLSWFVFARLLRNKLPRHTAGALILASTWCNATYLGLPVVQAVVGSEYRQVPLMFDLLGMSVLLFSIGTVISVEFGTTGERHTLREGIRQIIRLPPLIAAVFGLAVNIAGIEIPSLVESTLDALGSIVAPLMLFSIGLALRAPKLKMLSAIAPAVIIKLLIAPLIGFALIHWLIVDAQIARATLLEAAMPTMVLTIVFAERYGLDEEVLAQAIVISTMVSMITLPVVARL